MYQFHINRKSYFMIAINHVIRIPVFLQLIDYKLTLSAINSGWLDRYEDVPFAFESLVEKFVTVSQVVIRIVIKRSPQDIEATSYSSWLSGTSGKLIANLYPAFEGLEPPFIELIRAKLSLCE